MAEWMARVDFGEGRPVELLKRIECPVMLIQADADGLVDAADAAALDAAMMARQREQDVVYHVAEAGHLLAIVAEPEEYARRVGDFLNRIATGG